MTTRKQRLATLISSLSPTYVELIDESQFHHVPKNAETHFKLRIVSAKFSNLSKVNRHKLVYSLVKEELNTGLHALQLELFSLEEWKSQPKQESPSCRDGFRHSKDSTGRI